MSGSLFAAILLRGGVYPQQWVWSALGISIAGILVAMQKSPSEKSRPKSSVLFLIIGVLVYVGFQITPLPPTLVAWLSPLRASAITFARSATAQAPQSWIAVSVAPWATLEQLLCVLPATVACYVAGRICWQWPRRCWLVVAPIIAVAWAESLLGLTQFYMMRMNPSGSLSVSGTYVNRNHFAGLLEIAFPLAVWAAVAVWREGNSRSDRPSAIAFATIGLLGVAACLLFGIVISLSRMGFMCVIVTILFSLCILLSSKSTWFQNARRWKWLVPALLVLLLLFFLPTAELVDRFAETAAPQQLTQETRLGIWKDTVHMIAAYKWTGAGLGAYQEGFYRFQTVAPLQTVDFAHNDYLQVVAELGLAGAVLVAALGAVIIWRVLSVVISCRGTQNWELAVGILGAILAMALHSLTDFNLYIPANALVLAWLCGMGTSPGLVITKCVGTGLA